MGQACEQIALRYYQEQGYQLVHRNHRIAGVEVDLILWKRGWLLVEVKRLSDFQFQFMRVSWRQRQRLHRALHQFQDFHIQDRVEFEIIYIHARGLNRHSIADHLEVE